MIIDRKKLNPLEQLIYKQLVVYAEENTSIKISEAALYCGCSVSKISKFVKKLGFDNFKQFAAFLQGKEPEKRPAQMNWKGFGSLQKNLIFVL